MRQFLLNVSRAVVGWPPTPASPLEKRTLIARIAKEHDLNVFVETGTFQGEMLDAQRPRFRQLISIELSRELFEAARSKYAGDPAVRLLQGDSGTKLKEAVEGLEERALFWLDAHFSRGVTAGAGAAAPIMRELSCLTSRSRHNDAILIDDARLFGLKRGYPRLKAVREFATRLWPLRTFSVESDVICILPPGGSNNPNSM